MPSGRKPGGTRTGRTTRARAPVSKKRPARKRARGVSAAASTAEVRTQAGAHPAEGPPAAEGKAARPRPAAGKTIVIEQFGSGIGCRFRQKRILRSLGLRHPRHRVVRPDNPAVRGMVNAIPHLVRIVEDDRAA